MIKLGQKLIQLLKLNGVDYFFVNPGTEFTSIIEAYADDDLQSELPKPILVPHESVAVHMAYGSYLATGKPQAVMVHATIGAANAAAAIINASRMNIPLLFIAGRTPITEEGQLASRDKFIHWAQESYDQGAMLREYVKWDYELRTTDNITEVIERAFSIMNSGPKGPVYLQIPREILMEDISSEISIYDQQQKPAFLGIPTDQQFEPLLVKLKRAKHPLILVKTLGEELSAVAVLEEICAKYGIGVICQDAHYLNISSEHSMFCGYKRTATPLWNKADVILNLGADVPWFQVSDPPRSQAFVAHIAEDPLFSHIPVRSHRSDINLVGNLKDVLIRLNLLLEGTNPDLIKGRIDAILKFKSQKSTDKPIDSKRLVAKAINDVWSDDCILVNELSLPIDDIKLTRPGSYFRTGSASGLGWGLGAALGLALEQKDKTVIAVVGDGAYYFANPVVTHWIAQKYQLNLVTIILNNGTMESIEQATHKHFPSGKSAALGTTSALTDLTPSPEFEQLITSFGGRGTKVDDLTQLSSILRNAIDFTKNNHTQYLINVIIE